MLTKYQFTDVPLFLIKSGDTVHGTIFRWFNCHMTKAIRFRHIKHKLLSKPDLTVHKCENDRNLIFLGRWLITVL
jgi:hypothetical protein